jgi:FkbM family methyltransferase
MDVGMHVGEDTAYYLAKGFDVVAVEANPELARAGAERFRDAIDAGRLRIVHAAIAETTGRQQLAVAEDATIWSSLSSEFVQRNEAVGTRYRYVEVPTIRFEELLADVGVPYYLKVDIEGFDMLCVRALHRVDERPRYVSLESNVSAAAAPYERVLDELANLWALGYRRFKYVDQHRHPEIRLRPPAAEGDYVDADFTDDSSGPFGEETPGSWHSLASITALSGVLWTQHRLAGFGGPAAESIPARGYRWALWRTRQRTIGWYDLHAAL